MQTPQLPEPQFADIGGRRLAYDEVLPDNPKGTILLLTGLGSKRQGWLRQLPAFGREYRTLAMDHRDVGDSDPFAGPYTAGDQADDAAALLRALHIERAHVVGISMGGMIALNLAERHPDLVKSLVLVSTSAGGQGHVGPTPAAAATLRPDLNTDPGERAVQTYRAITAPGYLDAHPQEAELIRRGALYKPMSLDSYARQYSAALSHDVSAHLHDIRAPTLVVHGDADPLVPPDNGYHLAREIPGAKLVVYSDTGHIPIVERAEDFNRDVLKFIHQENT